MFDATMKTPKGKKKLVSHGSSQTRSGSKFRLPYVLRNTRAARVSISPIPTRKSPKEDDRPRPRKIRLKTPPTTPESLVGSVDSLSTQALSVNDGKFKGYAHYREGRDKKPTTKLYTRIKLIVDSFNSCRSTIFSEVRAIGYLQTANGNVRYESGALKVNGLLNHITGVMSTLVDTVEDLEEVGNEVLDRNTQMWMMAREKKIGGEG